MAIATSIPVEAYLRSSGEYEPDAEYVDGEVELRPMGEWDHASWQAAIQRWFSRDDRDRTWGVWVRAELRVQVSPTRFRVPDVVVAARGEPVHRILTRAPIAVFEVLSPEDREARVLVKLADYAGMGVQTIRLIDPGADAIFAYENAQLRSVNETVEMLSGSGCFVDWSAIRAMLGD